MLNPRWTVDFVVCGVCTFVYMSAHVHGTNKCVGIHVCGRLYVCLCACSAVTRLNWTLEMLLMKSNVTAAYFHGTEQKINIGFDFYRKLAAQQWI